MKYRIRLAPIAYDGWKFIFGFGIAGLMFLILGRWFATLVGVLLILLAVFCVAFFRDPDRDVPQTDDLLSPADGTVLEVVTVDGEGFGPGRVIRIFLSIFDGHIQRAPAAGTVRSLMYQPGVFLDARDPRAPFANESNAIELDTGKGRLMVKQISGMIARRIVCWVRPDDTVRAGDRIGLIRFGSQVDLYVPADMEILVREGEKVIGGQTSVARWPGVRLIQAPAASRSGVSGNGGVKTVPAAE